MDREVLMRNLEKIKKYQVEKYCQIISRIVNEDPQYYYKKEYARYFEEGKRQ